MSIQTSALDKQPYFPLTQQIWHKAWHAEEGSSMQSLCAKVACIVFPIIFAVAIVEGILLAGRKVLQLLTKQNENNSQDNVVPPLDPEPQPALSPIKLNENAKKRYKERLNASLARLENQRNALPQGDKERVALDKAIKLCERHLREANETIDRALEGITPASGVS